MMRTAAVCFAILMGAASAPAQSTGVVEGKLVNKTNPSIGCGGIELDVVGLGGGMSIVKSGKTDANGGFRIDGLPVNDTLMIRANYKDANYHGRVRFDAAGKSAVEIEVFEPTRSMQGIRSEAVRLAFQLSGDRLRSMETWTFVNETSPPRTYFVPEGTFRISKPEGLAEIPRMSVVGPGSTMPLVQSPLESPDGKSYYLLYALRPGRTTFEVELELPYANRSYSYRRTFFAGAPGCEIGVIPADLSLAGEGLKQVETNTQQNFTVYSGGAVKAGSETVWTLSGGTPVAAADAQAGAGEARIRPMPTEVGRNALVIGPLFLLAFVVVLWYALARVPESAMQGQESRVRELRARREELLDTMAGLDRRLELGTIRRGEHSRLRDSARLQLRRVMMLLKK